MYDRETVIQWYPGHMAAAIRQLEQRIRLIDVFVEVVDGRIPIAGANPNLAELIGRKPRLLVLSREDLADPETTKQWLDYYAGRSAKAVAVNARNAASYAQASFFLTQLTGSARTRGTARAMVVGIPNAGKSQVINGLLRRDVARVEDKAGVTRAPQWFRVGPNLEMMDTPGILVPKIESLVAQWMLAMCGAIPRDKFNPENVVHSFVDWSRENLKRRPPPDLEAFATARRMLRTGGELELHNAALAYVKDFNDGKFGRVTLESPPEKKP
ncbi:MAG: ribosome biogenesis GTPase YlqF [Candidatus Eremiobacteraeota bacterium]|nr:ribosome biogenesis GTPase YlqF [Candidatus Eremiobacteraeota bacterium]